MNRKWKKWYIISNAITLILIIPFCILLGIFFNDAIFHEDAIPGNPEHHEPLVYITRTGECYHSQYCSYVNTVYEIGMYQALDKGYRKCSYCKGEPNGTILIESTKGQPEKNNYLASFLISFCLGGVLVASMFILTKNCAKD